MIVLSWNCRGIQNDKCFSNVRELFHIHHPDLLFLMEIRCDDFDVAQRFGRRLGFDSLFFISSQGRVGGLVVFWKQGVSSKGQVN